MAGVGGMSTQVYYGLGDGVQQGPASLSYVVGFIDSDSSQRYTRAGCTVWYDGLSSWTPLPTVLADMGHTDAVPGQPLPTAPTAPAAPTAPVDRSGSEDMSGIQLTRFESTAPAADSPPSHVQFEDDHDHNQQQQQQQQQQEQQQQQQQQEQPVLLLHPNVLLEDALEQVRTACPVCP